MGRLEALRSILWTVGGPILFSIESLRLVGAIIDFREDLVVFKALNDQRSFLLSAERSSAGHQLLPLTQDWYEGAFNSKHRTLRGSI